MAVAAQSVSRRGEPAGERAASAFAVRLTCDTFLCRCLPIGRLARVDHGTPSISFANLATDRSDPPSAAKQSWDLSHKLAGRVDGEDVVQSAFRTFFRRAVAGEFHIDSATQLWQLLVRITINKARGQGRRHTASKRAVASEQGAADDQWLVELASREPGPDEAVILLDQIESLLAGLPPVYSQILELRLQGCTMSEIVGRLNVARRTAYRALELLQQRLEREV